MAKKLTSRTEDYSKWYNELVVMADLAENSGVRGCMVIKPYGYAIWEKMQAELDKKFKETGHVNAYFPLFIPKSYFSKEASHVDGFADFVQDFMAIPVIKGVKSESERFAGAIETYCIEALMQDGKALQAGTSHFLGQNFAKAFDVKFQSKEGALEHVWATSWGVSTRLMGALVMTHSDDHGLVLPPNLAPWQVVIVPIHRSDEQLDQINEKAEGIIKSLRAQGVSVKYDNRTSHKPGWKFNEYELKGVPLRIAIGPKDLEKGTVELARRDTLQKQFVSMDKVSNLVPSLLTEIQEQLYNKALKYRDEHITRVDDFDIFKDLLDSKTGFFACHWDGTSQTEDKIKDLTKATIRCIPIDVVEEEGKCILTGAPSKRRVLFAKAY